MQSRNIQSRNLSLGNDKKYRHSLLVIEKGNCPTTYSIIL